MRLYPAQSQILFLDFQNQILAQYAPEIQAEVMEGASRLHRITQVFAVPATAWQLPTASGGEWLLQALPLEPQTRHYFSVCAEAEDAFNFQQSLLSQLQTPAPKGNARSLPKHLQKPQEPTLERGQIILAGLNLHASVLQTALDLLDEEYELAVVTDACACPDKKDYDSSLDRLAAHGAELLTTRILIAEWAGFVEHPAYD